jgi:hypothetical protein
MMEEDASNDDKHDKALLVFTSKEILKIGHILLDAKKGESSEPKRKEKLSNFEDPWGGNIAKSFLPAVLVTQVLKTARNSSN